MERTTDRRVARWVTCGTLVVILLGAAAEAEIWPITSFKLFSSVRTAGGVTSSLIAVDANNAEVPVPIPTPEILATTSYQLERLAAEPESVQRDMARAWLELAGMDPDDYTTVALHRTAWTMDAATRERVTSADKILVEVTL